MLLRELLFRILGLRLYPLVRVVVSACHERSALGMVFDFTGIPGRLTPHFLKDQACYKSGIQRVTFRAGLLFET